MFLNLIESQYMYLLFTLKSLVWGFFREHFTMCYKVDQMLKCFKTIFCLSVSFQFAKYPDWGKCEKSPCHCLACLECAVAFRWVKLSEDIEFIERCKDHEDEVPDQQYDPQLFVKLPAVHMADHDQEDNSWKQAERGVKQTWKNDVLRWNYISLTTRARARDTKIEK